MCHVLEFADSNTGEKVLVNMDKFQYAKNIEGRTYIIFSGNVGWQGDYVCVKETLNDIMEAL